MVPVIIIAVVFTGLAVAVFYAAPRGKLTPMANAMMSQKKGVSTAINLTIAVVIVGFGIVIPAVFLVANHDDSGAGTNGVKLTAAETNGRTLYGQHCAVCHTLAAASAVGKTGPNLDQLKPSVAGIEYAVANGCLQDPGPTQQNENCLGYGAMPADIIQGHDAVDVAEFVHAVEGKG
jgi:mono/diheme cytochrome c family protein